MGSSSTDNKSITYFMLRLTSIKDYVYGSKIVTAEKRLFNIHLETANLLAPKHMIDSASSYYHCENGLKQNTYTK